MKDLETLQNRIEQDVKEEMERELDIAYERLITVITPFYDIEVEVNLDGAQCKITIPDAKLRKALLAHQMKKVYKSRVKKRIDKLLTDIESIRELSG